MDKTDIQQHKTLIWLFPSCPPFPTHTQTRLVARAVILHFSAGVIQAPKQSPSLQPSVIRPPSSNGGGKFGTWPARICSGRRTSSAIPVTPIVGGMQSTVSQLNALPIFQMHMQRFERLVSPQIGQQRLSRHSAQHTYVGRMCRPSTCRHLAPSLLRHWSSSDWYWVHAVPI